MSDPKNGDNQLSPWAYGDPETTGAVQASQLMQPAVTSYLHDVATGKVAEGGLQRLDVPYDPTKSFAENALDPARLQASTDIALGVAGGGLQFGAFHGTRVPFTRFSDEFIGSGEGAQIKGQGHYVGAARETGESYQRTVGGSGQVPADPQTGMPLTGTDLARAYYTPGTVVPSGTRGAYDQVLGFNEDPSQGRWSVKVQRVKPDPTKMSNDPQFGYGDFKETDLLARPDVFTNTRDIHGLFPRSHSTMPDDWEVQQVAQARGWQMRQPGRLMDVWIKPEHEDFMNWDLPFEQQSPGVQKILKDQFDWVMPEGKTGGQIYGDIAYDHLHQMGKNGDRIAAQMRASKELDAAGIPGNSYLDQFSRGPTQYRMEYTGSEEPPSSVKGYLDPSNQGVRNHTSVESIKAQMRNTEAGTNRTWPLTDPEWQAGRDQWWQDGYDFLDRNADKFTFTAKPKTHNYVVFNPDNIEVRAIDGRPVTPHEGPDPFAGGP